MIDSLSLSKPIPHVEESKQIVRQLCKNWQATANFFKTQIYQGRGCQSPEKNVSNEVVSYTKSESILLLNEPDEIASISNTIFLEELRIFCPVFNELLVGSSGQDDQEK